MFCGEPDLPYLLKSLSEQQVEIDHRVFSYMSEIDGHNAVYQTFNTANEEYIRAKIDADIVLHPGALEKVSKLVGKNTWLDPSANDYFTNKQLHAGMAFYGRGVKFDVQTHTLKCDRNIVKNANHSSIGVIADHSYYANELIGFHFGYHRGLKSQLPVYNDLVKAYQVHKDRVRLMAIRGFDLAQSDRYKEYHLGHSPVPTDHNYGHKLNELFDEFKGEEIPQLTRTWR